MVITNLIYYIIKIKKSAKRDGEFWHIFAKRCQEGRGILAHICQKVNKRMDFFKNNEKKPLDKNLSPRVLTCPFV